MAVSTYNEAETTINTYLGYAVMAPGGTYTTITEYTKLCDIIDYPDLSTPADSIEITTMSDKTRVNKSGLPGQDPYTFTALFRRADYQRIQALTASNYAFCLLFSESNTPLVFSGDIKVTISGAGVAERREMQVTITSPVTTVLLEEKEGTFSETTGKITLTAIPQTQS